MESKNRLTKDILINANIEKVYGIWTDIEKWYLWTKSIKQISYLENFSFKVGGRAKVIQPELSPAVWNITEIKADKSFTWETKILGVTVIGEHILESSSGGTIAKSILTYKGFLASVLCAISRKLTIRYMTMEMEGLKNECEKSQ
jgi:uncharacterized membrane protein